MRIVSDTASLFSLGQGKESGVTIVPACVIHGDKVYRDFEDINTEQFMKLVAQGAVPTTSQPAIGWDKSKRNYSSCYYTGILPVCQVK